LYPTELETNSGDPIPGSFRIQIEGLTDEDAVELWRAFGVSGSRDDVLPFFNTFAKHPLLIQALSGEVKRYRKSPGNFEAWRQANPTFDPSKFSKTKEAMAHVLDFALRGLEGKAHQVLQTIAAFRMPTGYDTLAHILIGEKKVCDNELELDVVLTELEDRGVLGWDKRANRYDLHPVIRGLVWNSIDASTRQSIYDGFYAYFSSLPLRNWDEVRNLQDLAPYVELYNSLVVLGRREEAERLLRNQVDRLTQTKSKGIE
jgi:hypothetical protein